MPLTSLAARFFELARKALPVVFTEDTQKTGIFEADASDRFPCIHRGETVGQHRCKPCDGARLHMVYTCDLMKRICTIRASSAKDLRGKRALCCLACDRRLETPVPENREFAGGSPADDYFEH